jgi:hypothetical protein
MRKHPAPRAHTKILCSVVLFSIALVAASSSGGCSSPAMVTSESLCDTACADYNRLGCPLVKLCNCSACAGAPSACDSYFSCVETFSGNCLTLALQCPIPSGCQPFISANCH